MKRNNRFLIMLSVLFLLLLTACSGAKESTSNEKPEDKKAEG